MLGIIGGRSGKRAGVTVLVFCFLFCIGSNTFSADRKVRATTTVTMITDLVTQIGGDRVSVQGLMGPGVDPHLYKATQADLGRLRQADVIFYNGLYLEGKMEDVLKSIARTRKHVHAITDAVPRTRLIDAPDSSGHPDPHVWFDVSLWSSCVDGVVGGLTQFDPAGKSYYEARGRDYTNRLNELHRWAIKRTAELPPASRILITSHDAFNYFGRAYGFKVVALQGISTVSEPSLADIVSMTEFIRKHRVRAVFVESSVPHKTLERVSQDAGVRIGGELFSDATGTPGQIEDGYDLGTYEGMVRHNVNTIVDSLK